MFSETVYFNKKKVKSAFSSMTKEDAASIGKIMASKNLSSSSLRKLVDKHTNNLVKKEKRSNSELKRANGMG